MFGKYVCEHSDIKEWVIRANSAVEYADFFQIPLKDKKIVDRINEFAKAVGLPCGRLSLLEAEKDDTFAVFGVRGSCSNLQSGSK